MEDAVLNGDPSAGIEQLEYDSRLINGKALFFAIPGLKSDGHDFIEEARSKGAVAVMGESGPGGIDINYVKVPDARKGMAEISARFYGFPGEKIKACGVTGTNGKTTTCYMLRSVLEARAKKTGLITTQLYDTTTELFHAERTTPESLDMQRLLYLMKKNKCVNVVIEVSSHALVLHRTDQINFRVAVYTNITRDHLDYHKSMEDYLAAKALLVKRLKGPMSYAVINLDVPEFRQLIGETDINYITYAFENSVADVYCSQHEFSPTSTMFDLVTPMGERTVHLKLPGRFNLMNALAAAAGGLAAGVDIDNVVAGLDACKPVPGRLDPIDLGQPFTVFIDYAHTPDALMRLCEAVREITEGRLLLLFGCGGDRDKGKRPLMGKVASDCADFSVVTSDNPRGEDPHSIVKEIETGLTGDNYQICVDRREAIQSIMKMARNGDVVLLAGKGAEKTQEINGEKHPFSDFDEASNQLRSLGYNSQTESEGN